MKAERERVESVDLEMNLFVVNANLRNCKQQKISRQWFHDLECCESVDFSWSTGYIEYEFAFDPKTRIYGVRSLK